MGLNDQELRMYEKWLDEANDKAEQLEQRYQQLEQVAWELYAIAITTRREVRFLAGPQMKRSVESREEHLSRLKEQLEALGVSLDD